MYSENDRWWLVYVFMMFIFVTVFISCVIILEKHQRYCEKKQSLLPLVPIFIDILYVMLYTLNLDPMIKGIHIWDYGDIFSICSMGFLEICIQTGMIPANKGYDKLFSAASYPVVILDNEGEVAYKTAGAQYPFPESEDIQIMRHDILGGSVEWLVDLKYTRALTQQLFEATQQLATRNAYLAEENRIKQEKIELMTRNRLYDRISNITQGKLSEIDRLLADDDVSFEAKLPKIAVLKAYIKRRGNMELLAVAGQLPLDELASAITESLEYIGLCGTQTAVASFGEGEFPASMVIEAYERFETEVEKGLNKMSHLNVTVRAEKSSLILRMLIRSEDFPCETYIQRYESMSWLCQLAADKEGQDISIAFTFTAKGGECDAVI